MYTIWDLLTLNSNLASNVNNKEPSSHTLLKINVCNTKSHFENCVLLGYYAASSDNLLPLLAAITTTRRVITQKSEVLSYLAVEA